VHHGAPRGVPLLHLACVLVAATGSGLLGGAALVGVLGMCLALPRWLLFGRPSRALPAAPGLLPGALRIRHHWRPRPMPPPPVTLLRPITALGHWECWRHQLGQGVGAGVETALAANLTIITLACPATGSKRFLRIIAR